MEQATTKTPRYGERGAHSLRRYCPPPVAIALGVAIALAIILGSNLASAGDGLYDIGYSGLGSAKTYITWAISSVVCSYLIWGGYILLDWFRARYAAAHPVLESEAGAAGSSAVDQRVWLRSALVIFALWVPVWLIFFPGIFTYDTFSQLPQILGGDGLTAHHPVLHTLFLSAAMWFGVDVLGSNVVGAALYAFAQMAICAACFGWTCAEIQRITTGKLPKLLALIWFGICPLNSLLAISCTKDVLFSAFFLVLALLLARLVSQTLQGSLPASRKLVYLGIFAFLSCSFRNNMLPALAVLIVALAIASFAVWKRGTWRLLVPLVVAAGLCIIVSGPVYSALGISKSSTLQEMSSVPAQQLARTVVLDGDLTEEDREFVATLFPAYASYQPGISDSVKSSFNTEYFEQNTAYVLAEYVSIGLKNPLCYLDAWLDLTHRAWYPGAIGGTEEAWGFHPYLDVHTGDKAFWESIGVGEYYIPNASICTPLKDALTSYIAAKPWEQIPLVNHLMSTGSAIWWILLSCGYAVYRRSGSGICVAAALVVLYWGTMLFGPCIMARYLYPLFVCIPWFVTVAVFAPSKRGVASACNMETHAAARGA